MGKGPIEELSAVTENLFSVASGIAAAGSARDTGSALAAAGREPKMSRLPRPLVYYGSAVVSVVLATLIRMLLNPLLGRQAPFATFFLATLLMAWYAGVGPSLLALALGGLS